MEPDVLVIGLGPAGASAAATASRLGLRVLALDRKRAPGLPVQCAELVPALIGQDVVMAPSTVTQSVRRMVTYVEGDAPDDKAPFPGHMIDRAEFDRRQVEAAVAAGADCHMGVAVSRINADGSVLTRSGSTLRAKLIVGADGPFSTVGKAINRKNEQLVYARQVVVPLIDAHDATDIFLSAEIPGGYGWLFPRGDSANVGVGVDALNRHRLKTLLSALIARLVAEHRIENHVINETGGAIPVGGMRKPHARLGRSLVLLAGDAAGLTNPVTGAGIHAGLVSGRLAGQCAAAWLAGDDNAPVEFEQGLVETFGASLERALKNRQTLLRRFAQSSAPSRSELREGWIAYPGYWRDRSLPAAGVHP